MYLDSIKLLMVSHESLLASLASLCRGIHKLCKSPCQHLDKSCKSCCSLIAMCDSPEVVGILGFFLDKDKPVDLLLQSMKFLGTPVPGLKQTPEIQQGITFWNEGIEAVEWVSKHFEKKMQELKKNIV